MGNLSSSPFPKKQSIKTKTKLVKPEVGGDGETDVPIDLTDAQRDDFLKRIAELKTQIVAAQATTTTTGGKSNSRKLRIKFA